jgi:cysteinyl-tRNA synthetase
MTNTIKIYNTFTKFKENFVSSKKTVTMYVCGITPYSNMHLGHARTYIAFDIIRRHLLLNGYLVKYVQNFTDVDDKIINISNTKHIKPTDITKKYIDEYFKYSAELNILKANIYPCVTTIIPDIINFIKVLIKKDYAYTVNGNVYFSVEKFNNYGILSNRKLVNNNYNTIINKINKKRSCIDFALWKNVKNNDPKEFIWNSPWGKGRPGWHIECSVIIHKFLGTAIDIHGGGNDLIFPHHENEIAQSEARNNNKFVKYWVHTGIVTISNKKMSKSLNNFISLKNLLKVYEANTIRYCLLTQHYSKPLQFSNSIIKMAEKSIYKLNETYIKLLFKINLISIKQQNKINMFILFDKDLLELKEKFLNAMNNNFNSEQALSYLHELKSLILREYLCVTIQRLYQFKILFEEFFNKSLGFTLPLNEKIKDPNLKSILLKIEQARKTKNWVKADKLKKIFYEHGYNIIDIDDSHSITIRLKK